MRKGDIAHYENTVGKGYNSHYEQFLLFPQCFPKTCTADTLKPGLVWGRVNPICTKQQNCGQVLIEHLQTTKCNPKIKICVEKDSKHCGSRRLPSFYTFPTIFSKVFLVVKNWDCMVKGLTHYQTTNFRLFRTERVCRQQFQI